MICYLDWREVTELDEIIETLGQLEKEINTLEDIA